MVLKCKMFKLKCWGDLKRRVKYNWRLCFAICIPIILSPIAWGLQDLVPNTGLETDPNRKFKALYVVAMMAAFWVFEVIPVAATSLFPLVLFPFLGVQDAAVVSQNYMKESNMIFLGAIIISLAIEYCGLHIRCALRVISVFGTNPARIMLGTMVITVLLSMWLSDTSCTSMLLPIISALTTAMFREEQEDVSDPEPVGRGSITIEPTGEPAIPRRGRRESVVFGNSALTRHTPLGSTASRRKSRSSIVIPPHLFQNLQNLHNQNQHESSNEMSVIKNHSHPRGENRHDSLKQVSSMSIIMEGMTVQEENEDEEEEEQDETKDNPNTSSTTELPGMPPIPPHLTVEDPELPEKIRKMLLFAIAYAASIGGTGSLIGTGPIKVFKELAKRYELEKSDKYIGITFATWMGFNIPPLLINIIIVWIFLMIRYMGFKGLRKGKMDSPAEQKKIKDYLDTEYKKLGPISSHELGVLSIFILVVLLWLFRDPQVFHGWDYLIVTAKSGDSTAAMLGAVLLFVIPRDWSFVKKGRYTPPGHYEALLDWKFVSTNAPWGYVLLIGSGYALSDGCEESGLSHFIAEQMGLLENLPKPLLLFITMVLTSVITEFVSNTAAANLILPIIFTVSCRISIHPLFLTMASAVCASYAFMLPISSPPNAIIFATGELEAREMIVNGLTLNIICGIVLYIAILTYGEFVFHFSSFTGVPCP